MCRFTLFCGLILQCERSSSGFYSASEPIDGSSVSTESNGPDKAVFSQLSAYRPHNSQLTIASSDMEGMYNRVIVPFTMLPMYSVVSLCYNMLYGFVLYDCGIDHIACTDE